MRSPRSTRSGCASISCPRLQISDQNEGGSSTNSLRLYLDTRIAGDGHGQVLKLVFEDISWLHATVEWSRRNRASSRDDKRPDPARKRAGLELYGEVVVVRVLPNHYISIALTDV